MCLRISLIRSTDLLDGHPKRRQEAPGMVLVFISAIASAGLLSAVIALVASTLRQRSAAGQEAVSEENSPGTLADEPRSRGQRGQRSIPAQVIYFAVLLLATVGYVLWTKRGHTGPSRTCVAPPTAEERLNLFKSLHGFQYDINTKSTEAQNLFNQGLLLAWNYAQPEAEAAFRMVLEADQGAAMAQWGIQYVVGPGANRAVHAERPLYPAFAPDNFETVYNASRAALQLALAASAADPGSRVAVRDLEYAKAAVLRWPDNSAVGKTRDNAETAYADALKTYGESTKDSAALAMAAEAIMNLHPWDYYTPSGELKETSKQAEGLIQAALELDPENPLANHLLIHISETVIPYNGLVAADLIRNRQGPWSAQQGHLLHMPSHTYVRTGDYNGAVLANIAAYNADLFFAQNCLFPYEPEHNTDMLIFSASMAARANDALEFASKIRDFGKVMFLHPLTDTFNWAKLPLVLVHFAQWKEIMQLERPGVLARANCPAGGAEFAQVVWRYVRVMAAAARAEGALKSGEQQEFQKLDSYLDTYLQLLQEAEAAVVQEPPVSPPALYICEHKGLSQIFVLEAAARIAFLRNHSQIATEKLMAAIAIEDGFAYMEPPRVYQPVRQCLGYVLMESNKLEEAQQVYEEDLRNFPENGWSLHGLSDVLHRLGQFAGVDELRPRLEAAWQHADTDVSSSCLSFSQPWGQASS